MERFAVFLVLFGLSGASPPSQPVYRDDYVYSPQTKGFFKLHADAMDYRSASKTCELEGTVLMVPRSIQHIAEVHLLFKQFPDIGDYVWIGDDGEVHESAEDQALIGQTDVDEYDSEKETGKGCLVLTREGQIESTSCGRYHQPAELPFVCQIDGINAPYDAQCGVYSKEYVYNQSVGSCYKISKKSYTWNQAYAECQHEGAHLVVLNSKAESLMIKQLMSSTKLLQDSHSPYYYLAGIRADKTAAGVPGVFKTIFNETLENAGFAEWADTEPNNLSGNEYCGSVYETDGKYNDLSCTDHYGFICEKEKHTS